MMNTRTDRPVIRLALNASLLLCAVVATSANAQTTPSAAKPKLVLEPCRLPGWKEDVRCGKYEVFEDREAKTGRKISLRVVVAPSQSPTPAPDPVFYFMGGPGGSAVDTLAAAGPGYLADLRKNRDLVFVDQRGTGASNPLVCNLYGSRDDMTAYFGMPGSLDKLKECRAELEKVADLRLYSTPVAMQDLDEVRAALGYDKINLYGGSYGATAALAYLRQYPQRVRTVTVVGVAPPDLKLPLPFAKGVQHSLDRLFADCAADEKCRAAFPNARGDFEAATKILEKGPVTLDAMNVFSKKPQRITLTRATFSELIRILLYSPEFSKWLPVMMQQAAGGDFSVFAGVSYQIGRSMDDSIARGMHYSVACAEFVAFITDADIAREMEGTFYGTTRMNAYRQACEAWPRAKVDKSFATPVKSDAPVLMISGDLDPVTPPWIAAAALRSLPNGRQVVGQNLAHSISGGCADQITEEFVRKGSARELDTSCIDKIRRPAFITTEMLQAAAKSATTQPAAPSSEEEVWKGVLDTGGAKLRLVLRLSRSADGKVKALLDSLDQDAYGMAVDTVTRTESSLRFEMNLIGGSYEGKVSADGTEIVGEWHQGGATLPLTLRREPVSKKQ